MYSKTGVGEKIKAIISNKKVYIETLRLLLGEQGLEGEAWWKQ